MDSKQLGSSAIEFGVPSDTDFVVTVANLTTLDMWGAKGFRRA